MFARPIWNSLTPTPVLIFALALLMPTAQAQSGDQPFEDVGVIVLPGSQPSKPDISMNWDCDALMLNTYQRYRPSNCQQDEQAKQPPAELEIEDAKHEPTTSTRRKFTY